MDERLKAFLKRTKRHLDRLARAGLDARVVRELVTVHTLATMGLDGTYTEREMVDEIADEVFQEDLDLPTSANEAAFFAERNAIARGAA